MRSIPAFPIDRAVAAGHREARFGDGVRDRSRYRGVLLDLAPDSRLEPDHSVTREDFEAAAQWADVHLESAMP